MLITILLCAALIGADQLFKHLAVLYLQPVGAAPVLPGVVGLSYLENTGAAFNMLAGKQTLLIIVTGAVLLLGAYILLFRRPKDRLTYISILMAFSGGVGNLIDRIARGYVVDYIQLQFMDFAIFNFADILVCVGFGLLVIAVFREEAKAKRAKAAAEDPAAEAGDIQEEADTPERSDGDT